MGKITQNQTGSKTHSTIRSKEPVDIDIDTIDGFRIEAYSKSWGANALRLAKAAGKAKPVSCTTAVKRSKTTGETATKKALDTLVKKEKENSEGDNPLCDMNIHEHWRDHAIVTDEMVAYFKKSIGCQSYHDVVDLSRELFFRSFKKQVPEGKVCWLQKDRRNEDAMLGYMLVFSDPNGSNPMVIKDFGDDGEEMELMPLEN